VAFVLHDVFAMPFEEIATIVERSPIATKKLASRARQKLAGRPITPRADLARHRRIVDSFLAASRAGDVDGLLAVLAPDVLRRADPVALPAGTSTELRGAQAVAEEARTNAAHARFAEPALVNGEVGIVAAPQRRLFIVIVLRFDSERIAEIDVIADRARLSQLDLAVLASGDEP
jgi:hypothetical protein